MNTDDRGWLRDRNRQVFGVDEDSFGIAWKDGKVGDIYKEESYYIEPNFGWLGKINGSGGGEIIGGENMKSKISGIGLRITKVDGEPIWGRNKEVKWNDLRGNNGWKKTGENDIEGGKRTIHVQRAAYYEKTEGTQKQIVDLGQGVCMLKLPRDNGNVYLVVGVAKLGKNLERDERGKDRRVGWDDSSGFSNEKWQICAGIEGLVGNKPTLNLNWFVPSGGGIKVDGKTVITLGGSDGITRSWKRPWDEAEKVAVVLGVAVKCSNWKMSGDWKKDGYKCKGEGERNWVNEVEIAKGLSHNRRGVISLSTESKWEPIGHFKAKASARFTWRKG